MDRERVLKYQENVDALFAELNYQPAILNNTPVLRRTVNIVAAPM